LGRVVHYFINDEREPSFAATVSWTPRRTSNTQKGFWLSSRSC